MCDDWPAIRVRAYRNVKTHRGAFFAPGEPLPALVATNPSDWETSSFNLVSEWVALCRYLDGWNDEEMAVALVLRRRIFAQYQTSALEVVLYDFVSLDDSGSSSSASI